MITFLELQHGHLISDIPISDQQRMEVLLVAINKLRDAWGKPMIVTSGWRSDIDQKRINPAAMHSKHMTGDAVDIADPDCSLYNYIKVLDQTNRSVLEEWGLWFEKDTNTHGEGSWVHCQSAPYGSFTSGKTRFFIP